MTAGRSQRRTSSAPGTCSPAKLARSFASTRARLGIATYKNSRPTAIPDQTFYETYACGAENNPDGYCNPDIDKLIDRQSSEFDQEKRKQLVWEIERKLAEDGARPIIYHTRAATCRQPYVKGFDSMVNSVYNGWRFEDVWLDK
jgi:ABC-type transport system substrate-binding protein